MSTDGLKAIWKSHHVIKVDRNYVEGNHGQTFNGSLIITFNCTDLPQSLPLVDKLVKIQKLKKKLLQCQKCHMFYHLTGHCRKN